MKETSADRNKGPILEVLKTYITHRESRLFEVGSGQAKHAIHFADYFKRINWVTSEVSEKHSDIKNALKQAKISNIHGPEVFKAGVDDFPKGLFDYAFTANTLHIMSWKENKNLFKTFGKRLREGSLVFIYGPFNYAGKFTSESNESFDKKLKEQDSSSGIRNFEDILKSMNKFGFKLLEDHEMPVNNRLLVFERLAFKKILRS